MNIVAGLNGPGIGDSLAQDPDRWINKQRCLGPGSRKGTAWPRIRIPDRGIQERGWLGPGSGSRDPGTGLAWSWSWFARSRDEIYETLQMRRNCYILVLYTYIYSYILWCRVCRSWQKSMCSYNKWEIFLSLRLASPVYAWAVRPPDPRSGWWRHRSEKKMRQIAGELTSLSAVSCVFIPGARRWRCGSPPLQKPRSGLSQSPLRPTVGGNMKG